VILVTGFDRADAIASLFVAGLMIRSGYVLQRKAMRVLLESAPQDLVPTDIGWAMAHAEHVREVHDLHLWELAPGHPILTAHVLVAPKLDCHAIRRALEQMLDKRFNIVHTTLQVEHAHETIVSISRPDER
jgi:cobalt-zinc-cadmium efflux system protein